MYSVYELMGTIAVVEVKRSFVNRFYAWLYTTNGFAYQSFLFFSFNFFLLFEILCISISFHSVGRV